MISLGSFSGYDRFAIADIKVGESLEEPDQVQEFEQDLNLIKDFTNQVMPKLLADIFCFFDSAVEIPIYKDRKRFGRNFELTDDNYPDGKKLEYDDCAFILESEKAFPDNKTKFKLNDFQYYELKLGSDNIHLDQPRLIFVKGRLSAEGKFDRDLIEQFSYTNFTEDGMEDGVITYTNSKKSLENNFAQKVPANQKLEEGAFIYDIDRPFAKDPEDVHAKQMLLLRSGFALRTV